MGFPALDLGGYSRRTVVPQDYVDYAESLSPGFVAQRISSWTGRIYSQLRKRYGNNGTASGLPFGASAPALEAMGTLPPGIVLSGVPILGSLQILLTCTLAGVFSVSAFSLSLDNGQTIPTTGIISGSAVPLPGTGLVATFDPLGTWTTDNVYFAPTPVPEVILGWIVALVNVDVLRKRLVNTQDPQIAQFFDEAKIALEEVSQAANSETGLFDLPANENADSAVTTSGPLSYTETSPYVSADIQECIGRQEDFWPFSGGPPQGRFGGQ